MDHIHNNNSIESKMESYITLAKKYPRFQHHVIFTLLDNSITLRMDYGKRSIRVANLKKELSFVKELLHLPNLHVYILRLERVGHLMKTLIQEVRAPMEERDFIRRVGVFLHHNKDHFPYEIRMITEPSTFERLRIYRSDFLYPLQHIFYLIPRSENVTSIFIDVDRV